MTEIIDPKDIFIINENRTKPIYDEPDIAHVFRYEYDGCVHRFLVDNDSLDFDILCLYGKKNGNDYKKIVKLNGNIEEKDMAALKDFESSRSESNVYKKHGVKIVSAPDVCEIDITKAKQVIQELNNTIQYKCDDLRLIFDYQHMIDKKIDQFTPFSYASIRSGYEFGMLLCLHNETDCVSSIELIKKGEGLTMNSKTMEHFEGKNYNKFLRSVAIIIAPFLGCKKVISVSENPSSSWILFKYYNADILDSKFKEKISKQKSKKKIFEMLQDYTDEKLLVLEVNLTHKNIENAETMFLKTLRTLQCDKHHRDTRKKYLPEDFDETDIGNIEWGFGKVRRARFSKKAMVRKSRKKYLPTL